MFPIRGSNGHLQSQHLTLPASLLPSNSRISNPVTKNFVNNNNNISQQTKQLNQVLPNTPVSLTK